MTFEYPPRMQVALVLLLVLLSSCVRIPAGVPPFTPIPPAPNHAAPAPQPRAKDEAPAHLTAARALLAAITPDKTKYRHRPTTVTFDPGKEECRTDCSGFITAVLQHSHSLTDAQIRTWLKTRRPVARTYAGAIARSSGFTKLPKIEDWQPGDLLAISYPRDADDTGHTMFINAPPVRREPTEPLLANTTQYELEIIDVTGSPHSRDTRRKDGKTNPGLGRGVIRIYADKDGHVAAYTWGLSKNSELRLQTHRQMVAGRYVGAAN